MDGNKDEAVKCVRIGKEALGSGDRARALKFFSKARRLDPNLPIDDLLSTASGDRESQNHPSPDDSAAPSDGPQPEMRSSSSSSSFAASASTAKVRPSSDGSSRSFTEEQVQIVRQIKKQKDYYQILGLEKGCTVEDVRKAYRKLSLKVHPDKNQAPGAEEAFKAVSKAFQCLSDDESRKRYDLVGTDEPSYSRAPTRHRSHGFDGFYEADFDADEIFRNFFGGMAPATTFHFRTGNMGARGMRESGNSNLRMLIQILPVIILLLLNFLPSSDPIYSLSRSYPYEQKLQTPRGVNYFVKPSKFEEDYPIQSPERIALEQRVEREYIGILTQNCRAELQRRHFGLSYQTPYCDMLQKFET